MFYKLFALVAVMLFNKTAFAQKQSSINAVGTQVKFTSEVLEDERMFTVYLPSEYEATDKRYPVLVVLDGQRYFLHGVSLQKSFVELKQTPPFIVVGIPKKDGDRNRYYSSHRAQYQEYLEKEVLQWVDAHYRTSEKRLLFGWAYAGGFALETMMEKPSLFNAFITSSPFPVYSKLYKLDSFFMEKKAFNKMLFFTCGTEEGMVKEGAIQLDSLLTNSAPELFDWKYKLLEGEQHRSTPFTSMYHGLTHYFKYYPELQFSSLEAYKMAGEMPNVLAYYKKRSEQFGFSPEPTVWTKFTLVRNAMRANDFEQFESFMNDFEQSNWLVELRVNRGCSVAQFYSENGADEQAILCYEQIAKIHKESSLPFEGLSRVYKKLNKTQKANEFARKAQELQN